MLLAMLLAQFIKLFNLIEFLYYEFRIGGNLAKYEIKHEINTASDTTGFVPKRIEFNHLSWSQKAVFDVILRLSTR